MVEWMVGMFEKVGMCWIVCLELHCFLTLVTAWSTEKPFCCWVHSHLSEWIMPLLLLS